MKKAEKNLKKSQHLKISFAGLRPQPHRTKRKLNAYLRKCFREHETLFLIQGNEFAAQFSDLPKLIANDGLRERELTGVETIRFIARIRGIGIHPGFVIDYLSGCIDFDKCMLLLGKAMVEIAKRLQDEIDKRNQKDET
jgi:hypothetical protein